MIRKARKTICVRVCVRNNNKIKGLSCLFDREEEKPGDGGNPGGDELVLGSAILAVDILDTTSDS